MTIYNDFRIQQDIARTINGGRLERVSDTELQWQPDQNGSIGLYNGTSWEIITPVINPSAANDATTISGSSLSSDTNYDVFATPSGSTFNLEFQEWAGDTVRYQDPVRFEGVYIYEDNEEGHKKRWLGAIRLNNSSYFADDEYQRFIVNYYNSKIKICEGYASSSPYWDYNTSAYREFGGGTTVTRSEFICLSDDMISYDGSLHLTTNTITLQTGLSINTVTAINALPVQSFYLSNGPKDVVIGGKMTPFIGYNWVTVVEYARVVTGNTSNRHRWRSNSLRF